VRLWDLSAGSAKLELALRGLHLAELRVAERWNDETYRAFAENYVAPLEPQIKALLDAVSRLSEVLAAAERQVRDEV
jgi:hypothetical protein